MAIFLTTALIIELINIVIYFYKIKGAIANE